MACTTLLTYHFVSVQKLHYLLCHPILRGQQKKIKNIFSSQIINLRFFFSIKRKKMKIDKAPSIKACPAISILVKFATILQIICYIATAAHNTENLGGRWSKSEPIMTSIATLLPCNYTIPPLIVMAGVNLCLIFFTTIEKVPLAYWRWKEARTGKFLTFANSLGLFVS